MPLLTYKTIFPDAHLVQFEHNGKVDSIRVQTVIIAHVVAKQLAFDGFITMVKPL